MESRGVMQASEQDGDRKVMFEKAKSQRSGDDAHHEEDRGAAKNMMQTEHRSSAGTENTGDKRVIPCQICMKILDPFKNVIFVSYHHN